MTKAEYLKKFSFFARWYLPASEAGDVIGDYTEMLHDRPDHPTLAQELGTPRQAVKLLMEKKSYRRWLLIFTLMAFCLLIPAIHMLQGGFYRRPFRSMFALLLIGSVAAILWFRTKEKPVRSPLPEGLPRALAAIIAAAMIAALIFVGLANGVWTHFGMMMGFHGVEVSRYGLYGSIILQIFAAFSLAAAFCGLIKARTEDRRWRALYIMGLTALIICTLVYATMHSMSIEPNDLPFLQFYLMGLNKDVIGIGFFGLIGLTATGVALC